MSWLAVPRLLWRPVTLWNIGVALTLAWFVMFLASIARSRLGLVEQSEVVGTDVGTLTFVLSVAAGLVVSWSVFELATTPFAWTLPGSRTRLRAQTIALGALWCAVVVLVAESARRAMPDAGAPFLLAVLALAAFGFAVGVYVSDHRSRAFSGGGWLAFGAVLVLATASPWIATAAWKHVWPSLVIVAVAAFAMSAPFSASRSRRRSLTPVRSLDPAYRDFDVASGAWFEIRSDRSEGFPSWRAPVTTDDGWASVTAHEISGWRRARGTISAAASMCLVAGLVIAMGAAAEGSSSEPETHPLALVAAELWGTGRLVHRIELGAFFVAIAFVMAALATPCMPIVRVRRPLSRRRSARVAWITSLRQDAVWLASFALAVATVAVLVHDRAPFVRAGPGVPPWLMLVLAAAACSPLARVARLWLLDVAHGQPHPARQAVVAAATLVPTAVASSMAVTAWRNARDVQPLLPLAIALAVIGLAHLLWRVSLELHFEHRDLAC